MASVTRADLLHPLLLATRGKGESSLTTAADLRGFLVTSLATEGPPDLVPETQALSVPQIQLYGFATLIDDYQLIT